MRLAGTPAAVQRSGSSIHGGGKCSSRSIKAAPRLADVGEEDADLAVLGPPGGVQILPLHAGRGATALEKAGLVDDQRAAGAREVGGGVGTQRVAHQVGGPHGATQEVLHANRGGVARGRGELPAGLALQGREEADQIGPGAASELHSAEQARHRRENLVQP
jgi:hypothetical protein